MAKIQAPYGSWPSPITTDLLVQRGVGLDNPLVDGADIYWLEGRPSEGGRQVIVRRTTDGATVDVIAPPHNARTRVHEYGGGGYLPVDGTVYFSQFDDQRLYRVVPGGAPEPLTEPGPYRYADYVLDRERRRLIAVREDHGTGAPQPVNAVVTIPLENPGHGEILTAGNDFYASPRLSPDGRRLAWLTWNHPNMPWDGTELWVAEIGADGHLAHAVQVAGHEDESIVQPTWAPDGRLYFASDRTGWWNLYWWDAGRQGEDAAVPIWPQEAEFAGTTWGFRASFFTFAFGGVVAVYNRDGYDRVALIRPDGVLPIPLPFTAVAQVTTSPEGVVALAGSPTESPAVIVFQSDGTYRTLRRSVAAELDPGYLSRPEALTFPTTDGDVAHAFYYPPTNPDYEGRPGEKPPLLVFTHGGPTGATRPTLQLSLQYWTSRGFAVVDVNYRGSTGYGRAYRNRLRGKWGVYDVDDVVHAARHLVERGLADPERLAIRGGSAGGYTTLAATTFTTVFKAGASHFGVSDCGALARETHKFESHYLDRLIGRWPEDEAVYRARSPLYHLDQAETPLILFQGLEDKVVPPNQAEMMVEALRKKGVPVAYLAFPGEGHGFRRAENITRAHEAEYAFYARLFGFRTAEPIDPPPIANLAREG
jgi:dipeptidyl aminopeptidase/acylaminoacyl peptidase